MSFELTQKVLRNCVGMKTIDKLVLATIADKIDQTGKCWPSLSGLSVLCGASRSSVIRSINRLKTNQVLLVTQGHRGNNTYQIDQEILENPHTDWCQSDTSLVSDRHLTSVRVTPDWCQSDTLVTNRVNKEVNNRVKRKNFAEENMNLEEAIAKAKKPKRKRSLTPSNLWLEYYSDFLEENEIESKRTIKLTGKEQGQLNTVAKKVGDSFQSVLKKCLDNWSEFVNYANHESGCTTKPQIPKIGYFVVNVQSAIRFSEEVGCKSDIDIKKPKTMKEKFARPQKEKTETQRMLEIALKS